MGFTKMKITTGLLATMAPTMLAKELKNYLQNVTFREDGNIVATYNTATVTEENPERIIKNIQIPLHGRRPDRRRKYFRPV